MPPDPRRAIRDPIHGLIPRHLDEIRLMNTTAFQRLRRIRQLAMAHLVYPSAQHTRFEHSIGTMHLAGRVCQTLSAFGNIDDERARLVRLAALLHDIGHGPFSHVSEYLLDRLYDREVLGDVGPTEKIHEKVTASIILHDPEICAVLAEPDRQAIVSLLAESGSRRFEHDIVSSSLDVDKMDYLLRDSYFAGVQYGQFDLEKIIDVCRVLRSGDESYLAFDHEGIYALEQLVLAKYHMSQQVYYHRVRAITDAMLVRGLSIAASNEVPPAARLYAYDGTPDFVQRYLACHDDYIIVSLSMAEHPVVSEIFKRLLHRKLLKEVCFFPVDEIDNSIQRDHLSRLKYESEDTRNLEGQVASHLNVAKELVIVTRQSIKNPTFTTPSYRLGEEEILVLDRDDTPRKISEFADLTFNLNTRASSRETVHVFAPMDSWNDPGTLDVEARRSARQQIRELVLSAVA